MLCGKKRKDSDTNIRKICRASDDFVQYHHVHFVTTSTCNTCINVISRLYLNCCKKRKGKIDGPYDNCLLDELLEVY